MSIRHKDRKTGQIQDDYGDEYVSPWANVKEKVIPEQRELSTQVDVVKTKVKKELYKKGVRALVGKLTTIKETKAECEATLVLEDMNEQESQTSSQDDRTFVPIKTKSLIGDTRVTKLTP